MKIEKVIFDMDGLIFDSERLFMNELSVVMSQYGYTLTEENYIKMLGLTRDALYNMALEMYGKDYPHFEISEKTRVRVGEIANETGLPLKKGIYELLVSLKEKHIPCIVASSTHKEYVELYLKTAGIREFFSDVIGGDMVQNSKPAPDIFLIAAGNTKHQNTLVLEDSTNGILAAHRANMPVICIPDMVYPIDEIKSLTYAVSDSAFDVIDILNKST